MLRDGLAKVFAVLSSITVFRSGVFGDDKSLRVGCYTANSHREAYSNAPATSNSRYSVLAAVRTALAGDGCLLAGDRDFGLRLRRVCLRQSVSLVLARVSII